MQRSVDTFLTDVPVRNPFPLQTLQRVRHRPSARIPLPRRRLSSAPLPFSSCGTPLESTSLPPYKGFISSLEKQQCRRTNLSRLRRFLRRSRGRIGPFPSGSASEQETRSDTMRNVVIGDARSSACNRATAAYLSSVHVLSPLLCFLTCASSGSPRSSF